MRRMGVVAVALTAVIAVGCNKSDNRAANGSAVGTAGRAENGVSAGDKDFVRDVATMNMAEIELSRTALQKGAGPDVKQFAQMMVDDHSKGLERLTAVATRHSITMPTQLDDEHRDKAAELGKKQGIEFDRAYADMMVDGHEAVVDKLGSRVDKDTLADWKAKSIDANGRPTETKGEAMTIVPEKSDNPVTFSLNEWAATTYPTSFAHLQAAKDLQKGLQRRTTTP